MQNSKSPQGVNSPRLVEQPPTLEDAALHALRTIAEMAADQHIDTADRCEQIAGMCTTFALQIGRAAR